jgi:hypothetical protein
MKLVTKKIEKEFEKYPLYSQESKSESEKHAICKFFNPYGVGTWIVYEAERQGNDWLFFGLVDLHEKEWGYFTLSQLASLKTRWGAPMIERDLYFN